jgi:hypothetical protein
MWLTTPEDQYAVQQLCTKNGLSQSSKLRKNKLYKIELEILTEVGEDVSTGIKNIYNNTNSNQNIIIWII